MYAFIGECYLVFKLKKPQDEAGGSYKEMHVDVMCANVPSMVYRFKEEQVSEKTILCGRGHHCHVQMQHMKVSKNQCHIQLKYNTDEKGQKRWKWILNDGSLDNKSTNGTWVNQKQDIQIVDQLLFKTSRTVITCALKSKADL